MGFIPAGAEAYKKDQPDTIVDMVDGGHYLVETHAEYIADKIKKFL